MELYRTQNSQDSFGKERSWRTHTSRIYYKETEINSVFNSKHRVSGIDLGGHSKSCGFPRDPKTKGEITVSSTSDASTDGHP